LLAGLIAVAVAGAGTSYADTASPTPNYAGRPHMGLMDPAPSTVPPGTGGIKPIRPVKPIPRPKPKPRPVADPDIIGYAADGTPIYPWGPKPLPPKPVKPSKGDLAPVGEIDPYQTPPIIAPWKLPPAPEVM
jgi:hypothetical protein